MPTYDYQCTGCGRTFEVFQRMSDEPLSSCSGCGAPARRRISGGAGFIFKGEGFYITDHRSQEYKNKAAAEAGKEAPASASGAGKGSAEGRKGKSEAAGGGSDGAGAGSGKTSSEANPARSSSKTGAAKAGAAPNRRSSRGGARR